MRRTQRGKTLAAWCGGKKRADAAEELGVTRMTLYRLLRGEPMRRSTAARLRRRGISLVEWGNGHVTAAVNGDQARRTRR